MRKLLLVVLVFSMLTACEEDIIVNEIELKDITSNMLINNPIIYEPTDVNITIENNSGAIESIVVYFDDEILLNLENNSSVNFNFNPELYPTGSANIKIEIIEKSGGVISKDYPITIHRKLLDVELDNYFFRKGNNDFMIFASAYDGSLLATRRIDSTPISFVLSTEVDIDLETPYMFTIASRNEFVDIEYANLYSIMDVTRSGFNEFRPKSPRRREYFKLYELKTIGFSEDVIISGSINPGYSTGYDFLDFSFSFIKYEYLNQDNTIDNYYINAYNRNTRQVSHMWINDDTLTNNQELNANELSTEDQFEGFVDVTYSDGLENGHTRNLQIKGYQNENEFNNNDYHEIWRSGHNTTQSPDMYIQPIEDYVLNTSFYKYSHFLHLEDYITNRIGIPLEKYNIPNWDLDFQIIDRQINLTVNGSGHNVGKLLISSGNSSDEIPTVEGRKSYYSWNINFDSNETSMITLPEVPQEIKNWSFGKFYNSSNLNVKWFRVERYENIEDYDSYLNQIIRENKILFQVSPLFEAKFISNDKYNDFMFDSDTFFD
ncbi:hypothetical protein SAMN04488008_102378 [Maribacter orientalis]|uniref:Uncharacterized protein n=1 Tax=Maribacter orientalis TaxID=228957 RepID=A0A1H7KRA1_9FLAO|nr:hypothetical protein [Maribacter orientalis]SEK89050.1 hypothetical protein SAMN04488008_102378 [Maribacter orientalis]